MFNQFNQKAFGKFKIENRKLNPSRERGKNVCVTKIFEASSFEFFKRFSLVGEDYFECINILKGAISPTLKKGGSRVGSNYF